MASPALTKVLVVDDDPSILSVLRRYLSANGLSVVHTDNGSEALLLLREAKPDIVLLDAAMPGLDGMSLCRMIKKEAQTRALPVVMMSGARVGDSDVVSGFEGGAEDYIAKPFSLPVLLARLRAVLRRCSADGRGADGALKLGGVKLDPEGRTASVSGKPLSLTRKEFDLLAALLAKPGRVLPVPYLLETVWGYDPADYNDPATVEVHVCHLRRKLGKAARHIVNVPGHGYKFEAARA